MTTGGKWRAWPRSTTQDLRTKKSTAKRSRANVRTLKSITFDQIRSIGFFGAKVSSGRSRKIKAKCAPFTPCRHSLALCTTRQRRNWNLKRNTWIKSFWPVSQVELTTDDIPIEQHDGTCLGAYTLLLLLSIIYYRLHWTAAARLFLFFLPLKK